MKKLPTRFTIRVYGLLIHRESVLLSKENIRGEHYVKFPGGGLEFGEGPLDCLKREFLEELNIKVRPTAHFYTTEDFVRSAFGQEYQVMSIYYRVAYPQAGEIAVHDPSETERLCKHGDQLVYWKPLNILSSTDLDLPIDQIVAQKLVQEYA